MNYNFIAIKPRGNFLTIIDPAKAPRYMCFTERLDAIHCISYVSNFRSKYGYFPVINLSTQQEKHEMMPQIKYRDPTEISKFLSIETFQHDEIDRMCSMTNINLFCIHGFSYYYNNHNEISVRLSAQTVDSIPDMYKYTNNLNNLYYK